MYKHCVYVYVWLSNSTGHFGPSLSLCSSYRNMDAWSPMQIFSLNYTVWFFSSVSSSMVGLLQLRLEVLGHVKLFSLSSTLQDGQIVCNKLKHFMVKVHLTLSLLSLIQPTPITSSPILTWEVRSVNKDMLWSNNGRKSKAAFTRKQTQGSWLELPMLYCWAMTTEQPLAFSLSSIFTA